MTIIIIPVCGIPYICKDKDQKNYEDIQEIVQGYFQCINPKGVKIHPLFAEECPHWAMVNNIIEKNKRITIYVNENGIQENLCPNMGVISLNTGKPFFGIVALQITDKSLDKFGAKEILITKNFLEDIEQCDDCEKYFTEEDMSDHTGFCKGCQSIMEDNEDNTNYNECSRSECEENNIDYDALHEED